MTKNKHETVQEPLTPTQRAERLLEIADIQLKRLYDGFVGGEVPDVEAVTIGVFIMTGSDPYKPDEPIIISEGDIGALSGRYGDNLVQRVVLHGDMGQREISAWLAPIRVDAYSPEVEVSLPVATLGNSLEGPTINGYPVETVEEIDSSNPGADSTLTRLEGTLRRLERATIIKLPRTDLSA